MFGMSLPEIAVVLMLGLIVFGPKRIPKIARTLGGVVREMRKAAAEVRRTIDIEDVRADLRIRNTTRKESRPAPKTASASSPASPVVRQIPASTVPKSNADISAALQARRQARAQVIGTRDVPLSLQGAPRASALSAVSVPPSAQFVEGHYEVVEISRSKGRSNV